MDPMGDGSGSAGLSCCEVICGRPRSDEPKFNLGCCRISKRVVKNFFTILAVLILYCFFLTMLMGKGTSSSAQSSAAQANDK